MPRKRVEIDWEKAEKLMEAGCNGQEIAAKLGVHYNTLVRVFKRDHKQYKGDLSEYIRLKRSSGDALLKVMLYKEAMGGDRTTLIFLAKSRLGMSDRPELMQQEPTIESIPAPRWLDAPDEEEEVTDD